MGFIRIWVGAVPNQLFPFSQGSSEFADLFDHQEQAVFRSLFCISPLNRGAAVVFLKGFQSWSRGVWMLWAVVHDCRWRLHKAHKCLESFLLRQLLGVHGHPCRVCVANLQRSSWPDVTLRVV